MKPWMKVAVGVTAGAAALIGAVFAWGVIPSEDWNLIDD